MEAKYYKISQENENGAQAMMKFYNPVTHESFWKRYPIKADPRWEYLSEEDKELYRMKPSREAADAYQAYHGYKSSDYRDDLIDEVDETLAEETIEKYHNYGFGQVSGYTLPYIRGKEDQLSRYHDYTFKYDDGDHTEEFRNAIKYMQIECIRDMYRKAAEKYYFHGSRGNSATSYYPYSIYMTERNDEKAEEAAKGIWGSSPVYQGSREDYPGLVWYKGEYYPTD